MLSNNSDKLPWIVVSVDEDKRTCVIAQAKPCDDIRVNIPFDQIRLFTHDKTYGHFKYPRIVHHEKIRPPQQPMSSGQGAGKADAEDVKTEQDDKNRARYLW